MVLNIFSLGSSLFVNLLGSTGFIGKDVKTVSDIHNLPFTPLPYTFSIWGLIYILLSGFAILNPFNNFILFLISCILNATWIVLWTSCKGDTTHQHGDAYKCDTNQDLNHVRLSGIVISLLTLSLILLYFKNDIYFNFTARPAFGIYLGWCICATFLNLAIFIDILQVKWVIPLILSLISIVFRDGFINISFIWASIGILLNGKNQVEYLLPLLTSIITSF